MIEEVLPKPFLVARRLGLGDVGLATRRGSASYRSGGPATGATCTPPCTCRSTRPTRAWERTVARVPATGAHRRGRGARRDRLPRDNDPETGEVSGCAPYEHDPYYHAPGDFGGRGYHRGRQRPLRRARGAGGTRGATGRALRRRRRGVRGRKPPRPCRTARRRQEGDRRSPSRSGARARSRPTSSLAALLFGDPLADMTPRLPDGALARVLYATAEPGGKGVSVRLDEALKRIDLLEATVEGYLDLVDAGTDHESHRFLETALARAHIAAGVAEMQRVPPPPVGPDPRPPIAQPIPEPRPPIVDPIPDPDPPKRGCEALTGKARAACQALLGEPLRPAGRCPAPAGAPVREAAGRNCRAPPQVPQPEAARALPPEGPPGEALEPGRLARSTDSAPARRSWPRLKPLRRARRRQLARTRERDTNSQYPRARAGPASRALGRSRRATSTTTASAAHAADSPGGPSILVRRPCMATHVRPERPIPLAAQVTLTRSSTGSYGSSPTGA